MIPVTQTKVCVYDSAGNMLINGNCLAACIASLLELPITEVPNVEVLFDADNPTFYYSTLQIWLKSKGYQIKEDNRFKIFHWGGAIEPETTDKYYLVTGVSPRGVKHVCIYKNGKLVHDPHPSQEGLMMLEYFESVTKIQPETTGRCCGRCDGEDDVCVSDLECSAHEIKGCETCYGPRSEQEYSKWQQANRSWAKALDKLKP